MSTPRNDEPASQGADDSRIYVSTIDIGLAKNSGKTIKSITLRKNADKLEDVTQTICAGGLHRVEFNPPISFDPSDHVHASVSCRSRWRKINVKIDINLSDDECMRHEDGGKSYRKKTEKVEVVVTAREDPVRDFTTKIIEVCSRFRLLIIGNSGVGKSTLIKKVFGVNDVHVSDKSRGEARIDKEFVSPTNDRFVVHDSLGFEAGDRDNMKIVQDFVGNKIAEPHIEDQLHAIWLCLETPYAGGRLLEDGVEEFLQRREEFLRKVPLVVVLTKVDLLDAQIEIDSPASTEDYKSKYMHRHCITPLLAAAGNDVTYVAVSTQEEYPESLLDLLKATMDNMDKYHVSSAPRVAASIAQRISIKEKIDLSMATARQKYWGTLWKSAVFRGHTMKECLQLIREDILPIWNFYDPKCCLKDDRVTGILLADSPGDDGVQSTAAFATVLGSTLQDLIKRIIPYGDTALAILFHTYTAFKMMDETYEEAKHVVETLIAYMVDLLCIVQVVFLLSSSNAVTQEMVVIALEAHKTRKGDVHGTVNSFNVTAGMRPGGCNVVLDKIEELIWRHSIPDGKIRELRKSIQHQVDQTVPTTSSGSS